MQSILFFIVCILLSPLLLLFLLLRKCIEFFFDGSYNERISFERAKARLGIIKIQDMECPKCGLQSNQLTWFTFRSSNASWRHLAGVEGVYCECPKCKIKVDDIVICCN